MLPLAYVLTPCYLPLFGGVGRPEFVPRGHIAMQSGHGFGFNDRSSGLGFSKRQAQRFKEMKRADEPLDEEVKGLSVLASAVGLFFGNIFLGSSFFGVLLAIQGFEAGPLLAVQQGEMGDQMRAAGWKTSKCMSQLAREAERRGVTRWLRRCGDSIKRWDSRTQASARLKTIAARYMAVMRRTIEEARRWSARSGLTASLRGIPYKIRYWSLRIGLTNLVHKVTAFGRRLWRKAFRKP